jgi:hypothetical protein
VTISFLLCASLKLRSQFFLPASSKNKIKLRKNLKNLSSFLLPPSRSQSPLSEALELLLSHWGVRLLSLWSCLQQQQQQQQQALLLLLVSRSPSRCYYTRKAYNKSTINEDFVPRLFISDEDSVNIRCILLNRIIPRPPRLLIYNI